MNLGDKIVWRFKDKKFWKRGIVNSIFNGVVEITTNEFGIDTVLVKQDEIEWEKYE